MKIIGIIPSRYSSTRFPGKPLADIQGKSMIRRVYEQAAKANSLSGVIVATDDERIFKEVESFGGKVQTTSPNHLNGTNRCSEVAQNLDADIILNIQGDEPFIAPEQIDLLSALFTDESVQIGTLVKEQVLNEDLQNPGRVKVVLNKAMEAMYFSRAVIPHQGHSANFSVHGFQASHSNTTVISNGEAQTIFQPKYYKHIGLYAYRKDVLLKIVKLPSSDLELSENLEQLRWLENGYKIKCAITTHDSISIDIPQDLEAIKSLNLSDSIEAIAK